MTASEEDSHLIKRFLDLDLSDEELIIFEERLSKDFEFEKNFQAYLVAHNVVDDSLATKKEQLRKQEWKDILTKEKSIPITKKTSWRLIGGVAASFVLLVSIWQILVFSKAPDLSDSLNKAWNKEVGLDYNSFRSLDKDSIQTIIYRSFEAYKSKNYQRTIDILKYLKRDTKTYYFEDVLLLRALSHYKRGDRDIALKTLDTLVDYPTGKKSNVGLWYQGLIYLEMGDTKAAKNILVLPNNNSQEIKLKK